MKKLLVGLGIFVGIVFLLVLIAVPLLFTPVGMPYLLWLESETSATGQNAYGLNGVSVPVPQASGVSVVIGRNTNFETGTSYEALSATTTMPDGTKGKWIVYVDTGWNAPSDKNAQATDKTWFAIPVVTGYPTIAEHYATYLYLFSRNAAGKAEFHDALLVGSCTVLNHMDQNEYFDSASGFYLGTDPVTLEYPVASFLEPDCKTRKSGEAGYGALRKPSVLTFRRDGDRLVEISRAPSQ